MLQAKRRSVMPAKAGIQGGGGVTNTENLDSRFRGKDGRRSRLPVDIVEIPCFEPRVD
jgi:hypothetical protein